ncbi:MAG: type II secretion system protein GspJ, partial [Pirellulales bacterium]|nr:type II secretion system protein GspJ [Pirellulales bacterium]
QPAGVAGGIDDPLNAVEGLEPTEMQGGLVRRSLDRAATIFAATSGGSATLNQTGELLAPEITGIEFAYWDGTTWLTEWSSDEYGELPTAVQVQLHMQDPVTALAGDVTDAGSVRTFKHIVRLPLARPIEEEDDTLSEAGI